MTIDDTIMERQKTHGDFTERARLAQQIKNVLWSGSSYKDTTSSEREAMDNIAGKLSRVVCGNPHEIDTWHDLAGYPRLVEQELRFATHAPSYKGVPKTPEDGHPEPVSDVARQP